MRRSSIQTMQAACLALFAQICCAQPCFSQQTFPYRAYVTGDEVYVRSGPGQDYYATDKLKLGQEVEVYRHDPGGWYAIRPVPGSFSWVAGRYLDVREDGLAVVREEGVAARVGSRLSDVRDVIQVRLREGEVVEILGRQEVPNGTGTTTWYKIAPPAGEFRWVFGKYVDPDYPADGLRKTTADPAAIEAVPSSAGTVVQQAADTLTQSGAAGWAPGGAGAAPPMSPTLAPAPYDPAAAPGVPAPATFDDRLRQLETELSMVVVAEPAAWSFDALKQQAEALLAAAQTAAERGRARMLFNKIVRFEDLRARYLAIAALRRQTEQSNQNLAALGAQASRAMLASAADGRFDGVGQLMRVVSPKVGAPRYALLDEEGQVRCYVSPAPGVNLRHYLGQRVGVVGTRGYIPEQQAVHVLARHVQPLEGTAWR